MAKRAILTQLSRLRWLRRRSALNHDRVTCVRQRRHSIGVARHGVVRDMSTYDRSKPLALLRDREVHAPFEFNVDLTQLRSHPLRDRVTLHPELPVLGFPADVRETQEVKRFRFPFTTRLSVSGGVPSELDEPRLVRMKFQTKLREPFPKVDEEPFRVFLMLEPGYEVVSERQR